MQYDEFIRRVQTEGGLDSSEEALQATEAVLATLGEILYRTEQTHVASELPRGISEFLTSQQTLEKTRGDIQRYSLEEFHNRVGARMNSRHPQAVKMTRVVTEVLMDAVSVGGIADIKQELPNDFGVLFERGT